MSRKWKIVLWTVVVVVVVVLGLRACGKRGSGDAEMRQGGMVAVAVLVFIAVFTTVFVWIA